MVRRLFHVQDGDRPMYVVAETYDDALAKWRRFVARENDCDDGEIEPPDGIAFIAESDDLLIED